MTGAHILVENVARQTCTDQQGEPYQGFGLYVGRLSVPATVSNRIRYTWYHDHGLRAACVVQSGASSLPAEPD